jgi:hypothetical protein
MKTLNARHGSGVRRLAAAWSLAPLDAPARNARAKLLATRAAASRRTPNRDHTFYLLTLVTVLALCACSTQPARVGDVWSSIRTETIPAADRDLFGTDRASHLRVASTPLPLSQQRQEFYVTWSGASVRLVKFEYRQANLPDTILTQMAQAADRRFTTFAVAGDDFHNGGPVSAWRVSLWDADRLLAEKKSMLW